MPSSAEMVECCLKACSTYTMQPQKMCSACYAAPISKLYTRLEAASFCIAFRPKAFISFVLSVATPSHLRLTRQIYLDTCTAGAYNTRNFSSFLFYLFPYPRAGRRIKVCKAKTSPKYAVRKFCVGIEIFSLAFPTKRS